MLNIGLDLDYYTRRVRIRLQLQTAYKKVEVESAKSYQNRKLGKYKHRVSGVMPNP